MQLAPVHCRTKRLGTQAGIQQLASIEHIYPMAVRCLLVLTAEASQELCGLIVVVDEEVRILPMHVFADSKAFCQVGKCWVHL